MKTFFFFGDSLVLGVNDSVVGGWPARVMEYIKVEENFSQATYYNLGVRKNSSALIAKRWRAEYEARLITGIEAYLIFSFGTVDILTAEDLDKSKANAYAILSEAQKCAKILFIAAPPVKNLEQSQKIANLNNEYIKLCTELGIYYYDPKMDTQKYLDDLTDGIHPASQGSEILACDIWQGYLKTWLTR